MEKKQSDYIIFGAGKLGKDALSYLTDNCYRVICFCDNNPDLWGSRVNGYQVISPEEISVYAINADILISTAYSEISDQLSKIRIENYISYSYFKLKNERHKTGNKEATATNVQKACSWVLNNTLHGKLRVFGGEGLFYPEVTGYTLPTMLNYGFRFEAHEMAEWLSDIQRENGSFLDSSEKREYYFDTAQVLRGFNEISKITSQFLENRKRAAEFLFNLLKSNNGIFPSQYENNHVIPETIQLFALPPMLEYAKQIKNDEYIDLVHNAVRLYLASSDALKLETLTHFLAYQIDGLIDVGYINEVMPIIGKILASQKIDGSIPGIDGVNWFCLTGMAQIAICLYKLGICEEADKIMNYLDSHQEADGGFLGSVGGGAWYFYDKEISWAVKFYLDAYQLRIKNFFNREYLSFPETISTADGRYMEIEAAIKNGDCVCEIGCGRGRFIKNLLNRYPNVKLTGVDISIKMLSCLPSNISAVEANSEYLPLSDNSYDVVYAVESIEHSVNIRGAIAEMSRICRQNGKIIIIDKQLSEWGRFKCPPWEQWPDKKVIENILHDYCSVVCSKAVMYENSDKQDQLMICWMGIKK
jgi:malonyl-CoA O-methyltransferase